MFKLQKTKLFLTALLLASGLFFGLRATAVAATEMYFPATFAQAAAEPPACDTEEERAQSGRRCLESDCKPADGAALTKDNCKIVDRLIQVINVLSAFVGIIIVIMIVVGGIQYSASRDNPQATAAAKGRVFNAILALVLYLFLFAFLQWIVPGGVFN